MRKSILTRLERLEVRPEASRPLLLRYGWLRVLPNDYTGERHIVIVKREPARSPNAEWCEFEERPGRAAGERSGHRRLRRDDGVLDAMNTRLLRKIERLESRVSPMRGPEPGDAVVTAALARLSMEDLDLLASALEGQKPGQGTGCRAGRRRGWIVNWWS
jgi:hypothetical protein